MSATQGALDTDFYQLTMAAAYHRHAMNGQATFSMFMHGLPANRGYVVAAGLEYCLDYLENFRFTSQDLDYLRSLGTFAPEFLDSLKELRFTGDVWALPEGTVCFAGEPVLEVTAPLIQGQLVETFLLNTINLHSTLASKAARCALAAGNRTCVDFSLRRTQGLDAGLAAARSSALAGFKGTSNVEAARRLGLKPVGTMAHSFIEAFGSEMAAFEAFAQLFPTSTVLLVDTYDTAEGLKNSVEMARRMRERGYEMAGVRLDSGDLVEMSRRARALLDQAGFGRAVVAASGNLDEFRISDLLAHGAAIDLWGVGTKMGSSADAPYLDLTYKLVNYDGRPTLKLSAGKETWAAPKQLWRRWDGQGRLVGDCLGLRDDDLPGQPLLQKVMAEGRRLGPEPGWAQAARHFAQEHQTLPPDCLILNQPYRLQPRHSDRLRQVQAEAKARALQNGAA